jgi:hypothetical protein
MSHLQADSINPALQPTRLEQAKNRHAQMKVMQNANDGDIKEPGQHVSRFSWCVERSLSGPSNRSTFEGALFVVEQNLT